MNTSVLPRASTFVPVRTDLAPDAVGEISFGRDDASAIRVRLRGSLRAGRDSWVAAALGLHRPDGNVTLLGETRITTAQSTRYRVVTSPWSRIAFTPADDGAVLILLTSAGHAEGELRGATIDWEVVTL